MFTGIIEAVGSIQEAGSTHLVVQAEEKMVQQLSLGASIAVNGVCLTVRRLPSPTTFTVNMMPETLQVTALGKLKAADKVNLELPLRADGLLGGHLVQGHVDGTATITAIRGDGDNHVLEFSAPSQLLKYLVEKGSVALNGVSLTLINAGPDGFSVGLIPHTWQQTTFQQAKVGDLVNLEIDMLAKYVYKFTTLKEKALL